MADEAFALSRISARPVLPGEADYDAIREAFMETSRGRWFLREYAKRNRNTDIAMVLDAVARVEQALAAQRQERTGKERLAEALAAVRAAVDGAPLAASSALASLQRKENLALIHEGVRIIKEISWRWRDIGADDHICDRFDSQIAAIEEGCRRIGKANAGAALSAAFDLIKLKLDELGDVDDGPAKGTAQAAGQPAPSATAQAAAPEFEVEAAALVGTEDTAVSSHATTRAEAEAIESAKVNAEAADAHDEAILQMVAIEMVAEDPLEDLPPERIAETDTKMG